ncbi:MAG: hypothetical protein WC979_01805 [Candidatus Pacearchaeota archaeon]|jgi:hypothetical protein|nr:hypothetical protein [Clostridia bacterium]
MIELNDIIEVEGYIPGNMIKLKRIANLPDYIPGIHQVYNIYSDDFDNYWYLLIEDDDNSLPINYGMNRNDWATIPNRIVNFIKDKK